jgi:hypothetical protein
LFEVAKAIGRRRWRLALFPTTSFALQFGRPLFQLSPELFKFGNGSRVVDGSRQAETFLRLLAQVFYFGHGHWDDAGRSPTNQFYYALFGECRPVRQGGDGYK